MVLLRSYLRRDGLIDGEFVPVTDYLGTVADDDYIEGAIEISVDDVQLLTLEHFDYVDTLWAYLVEGMEEVAAGRASSTYLPDQPIEIRMTPDAGGQRVEVAVEDGEWRRASTARRALLAEMTREARAFFEKMTEIVPSNRDTYADLIARIDRLVASGVTGRYPSR